MAQVSLSTLLKKGSVWLAEGTNYDYLDSFNYSQKEQDAAHFDIADIDNALDGSGLCSSAIHEFFAYDKETYLPCIIPTLLVAKGLENLISTQPKHFNKLLVWIGKKAWPSPFVLQQSLKFKEKDFLKHCLFIEVSNPKDLLWTIDLSLRCPAVASLVAYVENLSFAQSRRFALAAKKGQALALFIRETKELNAPSAAKTRWSIKAHVSQNQNPAWQLKLLKQKGKQAERDSWIVEADHLRKKFLTLPSKQQLRIPDASHNKQTQENVEFAEFFYNNLRGLRALLCVFFTLILH